MKVDIFRKPRHKKLSLYSRNGIFWIAARQNGRVRAMSLSTRNPAVAEARHAELEERWNRNEGIFPGIIESGEPLADQWLETRRGRVAGQTFYNNRLWIRAFLTECPDPRQVRRSDIENFLSGILKKRSRCTHNQYLLTIRMFFAWLVQKRVLRTSPAAGLKTLRIDEKAITYLEHRERARVLAAAKRTPFHGMVAVALGCGLRLGELQRLEWPDIDFKKKTLRVRVSKTGRQRQVPVPREVLAVLRTARQESGPCFVSVRGAITSNLSKFMKRIRKSSGVETAGWNVFRHTFASLLVQKGVSLFKVSKWLGHTDYATTLRHYASLAPGYDSDVEL